jgi:hypothetical protein
MTRRKNDYFIAACLILPAFYRYGEAGDQRQREELLLALIPAGIIVLIGRL